MIQANYFVIDSMYKKLTYGVDVYQVWECAKHSKDNDELGQTLKYETSSKAKANAVSEYLNIKAELDYSDTFRTLETQGTIVPHTIKV
jgi:hypothetical protein